MNEFDPYQEWLGIPPHERPADYYRLLGLRRFETDPSTVQSAADQRMASVRTYQTGRRGPYTQKMLNELAMAKLCLLDPFSKAEYDASLATHMSLTSSVADALLPASMLSEVPINDAYPVVPNRRARSKATTNRRTRNSAGKSHRFGWLPTLGLAVGIILALGLWGTRFMEERRSIQHDVKPTVNEKGRPPLSNSHN